MTYDERKALFIRTLSKINQNDEILDTVTVTPPPPKKTIADIDTERLKIWRMAMIDRPHHKMDVPIPNGYRFESVTLTLPMIDDELRSRRAKLFMEHHQMSEEEFESEVGQTLFKIQYGEGA